MVSGFALRDKSPRLRDKSPRLLWMARLTVGVRGAVSLSKTRRATRVHTRPGRAVHSSGFGRRSWICPSNLPRRPEKSGVVLTAIEIKLDDLQFERQHVF